MVFKYLKHALSHPTISNSQVKTALRNFPVIMSYVMCTHLPYTCVPFYTYTYKPIHSFSPRRHTLNQSLTIHRKSGMYWLLHSKVCSSHV